MKGNKKILVAIVLLLLVSVTFTTLAIYRSSANGTGTIKAAKWDVKVNGTAIESATMNFDISNITWTTHTGKNNTIAPGDSGTITIPVDASGSEVDVLLTAAIGSGASLPAGFTAEVTSGTAGVQTIEYGATMTANVVVTVTWTGTIADETGKDTTDKAVNDTNLSIPVTLEARQKLATD
jgi:hypothetical protein